MTTNPKILNSRDSLNEDDSLFFHKHGYLILRGIFSESLMHFTKLLINQTTRHQYKIEEIRRITASGERPGFKTILTWQDTSGKDVFSQICRHTSTLGKFNQLFDCEMFVSHIKLICKKAGFGGFRMHQDFWFWRNDGSMYPDTGACWVALDQADKSNGCLKVVPGSHRFGLMNHDYGDKEGSADWGIDNQQLEKITSQCGIEECHLNPGDVILFNGLTVHGSDDNTSDQDRYTLIGCYDLFDQLYWKPENGFSCRRVRCPVVEGPVNQVSILPRIDNDW